jgi:hypothetical protein
LGHGPLSWAQCGGVRDSANLDVAFLLGVSICGLEQGLSVTPSAPKIGKNPQSLLSQSSRRKAAMLAHDDRRSEVQRARIYVLAIADASVVLRVQQS